MEKADANQNAGKSIRVRILGNSYQEPYHQSIFVTSEQPLFVEAVQNRDYDERKYLEKSSNSDSFQLEFTASELSAGKCLCIFTQEKNGILTMPKLIRAAIRRNTRGDFFYMGRKTESARKRIAAGAVPSGRGSQ